MVTLEQVRAGASERLYPRHVLGGRTALVLFAAAFHGQQDAVWMAEAGLTATCVDVDAEKLGEMEQVYPSDWDYVYGDAFAFALATERQWDIVSLDPPSNLFDRCAELLPMWCRLADMGVILGHGKNTAVMPPDGWWISDQVKRSTFAGGCYWTVIRREPC
jgi:hypothetical protein